MVKINLWRLAKSLGKEFELENLSIVGIHANIEKPNTDLHDKNSNVEYIINHIDKLGLIPPPEDPKAAAEREKAEKEKAEKEKADAEAGKKNGEKEPPAEPAAPLDLKIVLGKIQVGDIGAGVCIRNVPIVGRIAFHPTIGLIKFENIQRDIFGGREDLSASETVACIITAVSKKIIKSVVTDMPEQLKRVAKEALAGGAHQAAEKVKAKIHDGMTSCGSGCFAGMMNPAQKPVSKPGQKALEPAAEPKETPEPAAEPKPSGDAAPVAPAAAAVEDPAPVPPRAQGTDGAAAVVEVK